MKRINLRYKERANLIEIRWEKKRRWPKSWSTCWPKNLVPLMANLSGPLHLDTKDGCDYKTFQCNHNNHRNHNNVIKAILKKVQSLDFYQTLKLFKTPGKSRKFSTNFHFNNPGHFLLLLLLSCQVSLYSISWLLFIVNNL